MHSKVLVPTVTGIDEDDLEFEAESEELTKCCVCGEGIVGIEYECDRCRGVSHDMCTDPDHEGLCADCGRDVERARAARTSAR